MLDRWRILEESKLILEDSFSTALSSQQLLLAGTTPVKKYIYKLISSQRMKPKILIKPLNLSGSTALNEFKWYASIDVEC